MAKDYRKRPAGKRKGTQAARRKSASRGSTPAWFWLLAGFLPGLFLAGLVHFHHDRDAPPAARGGLPDDTITPVEDVATSLDDDSRPRFEFYKLLSESEVVVPDEPARPRQQARADVPEPPLPETPPAVPPEQSPVTPPAGERPPAPTPPAEDRRTAETEQHRPEPTADDEGPVQYLIQAGSFRNRDDADRLRARLALMGVEAEIQSVQIEGGGTWHRVRVGPLTDRNRADRVRARLEQENVSSILLRTRG